MVSFIKCFNKFHCRIIIISCVINVVIQITFDIWKYVSSVKNVNDEMCDILINGSLFWTESLWFISRNNACTLWLIPFLYIFVPRNFFRTLCNKKQTKSNDNLSDESSVDGEFEYKNGQYAQRNGKKMSQKRDSFLGDLEQTDGGSSDEGSEDKKPTKHYLGNINLASSNGSKQNQPPVLNHTFENKNLFDDDTASEDNHKS